MGSGLLDFWREFRKDASGLIGLSILIISAATVIFEPVLLPWPEVNSRWRDINYWQDNSPSAPPAWTNAFSAIKSPLTERIDRNKRVESDLDGGARMIRMEFAYRYRADTAPLDLIFHGVGTGDIPVMISVERPDGKILDLVQTLEQGASESDIRISIANDGQGAAFAFLKEFESEEALQASRAATYKVPEVVFGQAKPGSIGRFESLKGEYRFVATVILTDPTNYRIEKPYFVLSGSVSGILGTDNMKRDLFSGLIAGLKWALLIGLLTSILSVIIGVLYGIISAYYGGVVDAGMQFVYQIVSSIPVLPVLIVVSAVFKPSIWFIILAMVIFFWTGPVMTVRSMALQIKEETYIEAARAYGSSHRRIILKHMLPILIPYSFASMALAVPGAIVYESSVSLLGLGDATIVTLGQILHDAMNGGAILNGIWWWIIPPGLMIAVLGMTFAFIGFAMDKILHPKLRTR
jgi:peptide/nickel transport system permease protein